MIWNLYLPPPRGAAVGSCSDGVSIAAAPLATASATRRRQARGKNKGRARPAEGQRPSEFLRCPSGKSKPQTQDLLASILPKT